MIRIFARWAAAGASVAFVSALLGATITSIYATGKIDYCFVDHSNASSNYTVYGHRPWRSNVAMADTEDAIDAYTTLKFICPIKE